MAKKDCGTKIVGEEALDLSDLGKYNFSIGDVVEHKLYNNVRLLIVGRSYAPFLTEEPEAFYMCRVENLTQCSCGKNVETIDVIDMARFAESELKTEEN